MISPADRAIDRALADLCRRLPLLLAVTPTNVERARSEFLSAGLEEPQFEYRPLPDLDAASRTLDQIRPAEGVDPVLSHLFVAKHRELRTRIALLRARNSPASLAASLELFGHVDDTLVATATALLEEPYLRDVGPTITALQFANHARREVERYRRACATWEGRVLLREDVSGVLVEQGDLLIGAGTVIATSRIQPLLHHEVGTHMLTHANGTAQPLRLLSVGLAGYDELQEALGVLAEYLSGGLNQSRIRVMAARVIAARRRIDGLSFRNTFDDLVAHGLSRGAAFATTMRAYRAGGVTKDAVYLRGLLRLADVLAAGEDIAPLYVGKLSFEAAPLLEDLTGRGVLVPPPVLPRILVADTAHRRLEDLRNGVGILTTQGATT